jgi:urea transport system substrate-binding protein
MAAAYTGVHLWAAAVRKANSFAHADVKAALPGVSVKSPMGTVTVSATNQHTVKSWYLGTFPTDHHN